MPENRITGELFRSYFIERALSDIECDAMPETVDTTVASRRDAASRGELWERRLREHIDCHGPVDSARIERRDPAASLRPVRPHHYTAVACEAPLSAISIDELCNADEGVSFDWGDYASSYNPSPASPRDPNTVRCHFCNADSMTRDDNGLHGGHIVYSHGWYHDTGRVTPRFDRRTLYICDYCFEHRIGTATCDHCGDVFTSDSMFTVIENGEQHGYCPVCAAALHAYCCPVCGDFFVGGEGDHPVCDDCRENAVTCDHCGRIVHRNESITDDTGRVLCENCSYQTINNINRVQGWDYRPQRFFTHSTSSESGLRTPLYMGVEVEMDIPVKVVRYMGSAKRFEATARHSHKLYEMNQPVYFKHDGSLNCGFEIVSHPCTLAYHTSEVDWKKMFRASIKAGFRAHKTTTCGLHVHVNRTFFGASEIQQDLNIAKIILLVSKFWDSHIVNFSRRDYSALERYAKKPDMQYDPGDDESSMIYKVQCGKHTGNHDDRYYAVNIQNDDTVEFRIFKGTLNHATFLASLQWVKVLCEYVKTLGVRQIYSVTWDQIFGGSEYEELNTYMKKRNLI